MFGFSIKKINHNDIAEISRSKIISIFLLASVTAVLLMLTAIYKGAGEYSIKNAIQRSFDLVTVKTKMAFSDIDRVLDKKDFKGIVENISDDGMTLVPVVGRYPETINVANKEIDISFNQLQSSKLDSNGGSFEQNGSSYIWSLIAIEDQLYPVLSVTEFSADENNLMLSVFSNRLIIPSIFIIWLTVWGALVYSRLLSRIYMQSASLEKFVSIDSLTGLQNQKQAGQFIEMHLSRSHRFNRHLPVLMVLLEDYSEICEYYGQSFSDAMTLTISQRLNDTLRSYDQILRYRDNVFMVILADENRQSAALVEKRIYKQLAQQYEIYGHNIQPTFAIETVIYPEDTHQMEDFIKECNRRIDNRLAGSTNFEAPSVVESQIK